MTDSPAELPAVPGTDTGNDWPATVVPEMLPGGAIAPEIAKRLLVDFVRESQRPLKQTELAAAALKVTQAFRTDVDSGHANQQG